MANASAPVVAGPAKTPIAHADGGRLHTDGTSLKAPKEAPKDAKPTDETKSDVAAPAAEETTEQLAAKPELEATDKAKPKETKASARFAQLAREEAAIRLERDRTKAREKELETKEQALAERLKKAERLEYFDQVFAQARQDTPEGRAARQKIQAETGLDFKLMAKDVVEGDKIDPRQLVQSELEKYKAAEAEARKKAEAEAKAKADQENTAKAIANTRAQLKRLADDSGDKYELVKLNNASGAAFDLMVAQYNLDKTVMSLDDALARCEKDLERQEAEKWTKSTKLKALVKPEASKKAGSEKETSLKAPRETSTSRPVGESAARETAQNGVASFNSKRHVNELLARHRARLNT
jgi:hypothetical protein